MNNTIKGIKFEFAGQQREVSIHHGQVWLEMEGGVSTPLAMQNCEHGGQYAYLTAVTEDGGKEFAYMVMGILTGILLPVSK